MEEINLELEKDSHKTINFNNSTPSTGDLNVIQDKKEIDNGLDLLINKSKVGGDSPKPIEEFKPSEQIKLRTPSPVAITLENTPSFNNTNHFQIQIQLHFQIQIQIQLILVLKKN